MSLRRTAVIAFALIAPLLLGGCDPVLSVRYGRFVSFPAPESAPVAGRTCARSLARTGTVGPSGEVLTCERSSARSWKWRQVIERRDAKVSVLVYGDSLAEESAAALGSALGDGYAVSFRVFGGTAPCDWSPNAARDMRAYKPDVVVTSFIGNNLTPCAAADGAALVDVYRRALGDIARAASASGAVTLMVTSPPPVAGGSSWLVERSSSIARGTVDEAHVLAASGLMVFAAADGRVLAAPGADAGTFTMDCLPKEFDVCRDGVVEVRNGDGVHLCPSNSPRPVGFGCPVRAPGAERFAAAIAESVTALVAGAAPPRQV